MKNRIPDYLPTTELTDQPPKPAIQELLKVAQKQIADRVRQVKTCVLDHPATGIGAAFCIGMFLGWIIKRK